MKKPKHSRAAKFKFYFVRGSGLVLIHIVPISLLAYFLYNYKLIIKIITYTIYGVIYWYMPYLKEALHYLISFLFPLAIYSLIGVFLWALLLWPVLRKYFPPLFLDTDGIELREGRVWWKAPNRITNKFESWAKKGGIKYENKSIWLYRVGKLINPFKPLKSLNKLYVPEEVKDHIDIQPKRIIFRNLYILKYRDGYILSHSRFRSEDIDIETLNKTIKEDATRISSTVGDYALTNPELRVKNVSSALFWVPPANLEIKEHLNVSTEEVGFQILSELLEKYDRNKDKAMRDGVITAEEISGMLLPVFNQILMYANSIKAKFGNEDIPDPPELKDNLITLSQMESYINGIRSAIATYRNPEVFR